MGDNPPGQQGVPFIPTSIVLKSSQPQPPPPCPFPPYPPQACCYPIRGVPPPGLVYGAQLQPRAINPPTYLPARPHYKVCYDIPVPPAPLPHGTSYIQQQQRPYPPNGILPQAQPFSVFLPPPQGQAPLVRRPTGDYGPPSAFQLQNITPGGGQVVPSDLNRYPVLNQGNRKGSDQSDGSQGGRVVPSDRSSYPVYNGGNQYGYDSYSGNQVLASERNNYPVYNRGNQLGSNGYQGSQVVPGDRDNYPVYNRDGSRGSQGVTSNWSNYPTYNRGNNDGSDGYVTSVSPDRTGTVPDSAEARKRSLSSASSAGEPTKYPVKQSQRKSKSKLPFEQKKVAAESGKVQEQKREVIRGSQDASSVADKDPDIQPAAAPPFLRQQSPSQQPIVNVNNGSGRDATEVQAHTEPALRNQYANNNRTYLKNQNANFPLVSKDAVQNQVAGKDIQKPSEWSGTAVTADSNSNHERDDSIAVPSSTVSSPTRSRQSSQEERPSIGQHVNQSTEAKIPKNKITKKLSGPFNIEHGLLESPEKGNATRDVRASPQDSNQYSQNLNKFVREVGHKPEFDSPHQITPNSQTPVVRSSNKANPRNTAHSGPQRLTTNSKESSVNTTDKTSNPTKQDNSKNSKPSKRNEQAPRQTPAKDNEGGYKYGMLGLRFSPNLKRTQALQNNNPSESKRPNSQPAPETTDDNMPSSRGASPKRASTSSSPASKGKAKSGDVESTDTDKSENNQTDSENKPDKEGNNDKGSIDNEANDVDGTSETSDRKLSISVQAPLPLKPEEVPVKARPDITVQIQLVTTPEQKPEVQVPATQKQDVSRSNRYVETSSMTNIATPKQTPVIDAMSTQAPSHRQVEWRSSVTHVLEKYDVDDEKVLMARLYEIYNATKEQCECRDEFTGLQPTPSQTRILNNIYHTISSKAHEKQPEAITHLFQKLNVTPEQSIRLRSLAETPEMTCFRTHRGSITFRPVVTERERTPSMSAGSSSDDNEAAWRASLHSSPSRSSKRNTMFPGFSRFSTDSTMTEDSLEIPQPATRKAHRNKEATTDDKLTLKEETLPGTTKPVAIETSENPTTVENGTRELLLVAQKLLENVTMKLSKEPERNSAQTVGCEPETSADISNDYQCVDVCQRSCCSNNFREPSPPRCLVMALENIERIVNSYRLACAPNQQRPCFSPHPYRNIYHPPKANPTRMYGALESDSSGAKGQRFTSRGIRASESSKKSVEKTKEQPASIQTLTPQQILLIRDLQANPGLCQLLNEGPTPFTDPPPQKKEAVASVEAQKDTSREPGLRNGPEIVMATNLSLAGVKNKAKDKEDFSETPDSKRPSAVRKKSLGEISRNFSKQSLMEKSLPDDRIQSRAEKSLPDDRKQSRTNISSDRAVEDNDDSITDNADRRPNNQVTEKKPSLMFTPLSSPDTDTSNAKRKSSRGNFILNQRASKTNVSIARMSTGRSSNPAPIQGTLKAGNTSGSLKKSKKSPADKNKT